MAQLITVRLNKSEQQPLGFRLQGGKDFGTPLVVQKVNGGSAAERAGLQAGDALIRVNNTEVYTLRHQEAQDTIRAAGAALELTVQRGGGTWRPSVTPTGSLPRPGSRPLGTSPAPVTNTSLKATPQASRAFGSGHNSVAKPFGYMNGTDSMKGIVNKQYNTPVNMYSDKTIAETLSAQTEVLAGGVLGVNFKKNEKTYDSEKSAVFKVLQEEQNDPEPEPPHTFYSRASVTRAAAPSARSLHSHSRTQSAPPPHLPKPQSRRVQSLSREGQSSDRLVPEAPHRPSIPVGCHQVLPDGRIALGVPAHPQPSNHSPVVSDTPFCSDCDSHIVGVFVRIKDKNLHVECFKCSTCGSSLKNQGYYNLNGKLYCDIHAKLVARQNPPAPNLEPVTVAPGGRIPTNPYTTPLPPLSTGNYTNGSSSLFSPSSNLSGPKPFGSSIGSAYSPSLSPRSAPMSPARPVVAPAHTPAPAAPLSAPFAPNKNVKSIVWPPPNPPEDDTPLQTSSEYAPSDPTGDPASFTTGTLLKKATESKVEKDQIVSDKNTIRTSPPRSRPSTPSLINKPAPIIPRYQMNLVTMEHFAPESHTYQPPGGEGSRTPTPKPRSRTPAQGPSSKAQAPRIKDYSQTNFSHSETFSHQLPSTFQRDLYQVQSQPRFYENKPPLVQEENRSTFERQSENYNKGDMSIKQDTMMNQNYGQRQMESQNVAEYGHTTVQTTRKTFEEYESAQSAKMIEIKKGGFASSDSSQPIEAFDRPSAINFKQSLPSPAMSFSPSTQNFSSNITNENVDTTRQTHTSTFEMSPSISGANRGPVCDPTPSTGSSVGAAARGKTFGVSSAPKRGRGVLNKAVLPGSRVPLCGSCNGNVRGPFITALGRIWCPEHFICVNATCRRPLQDIGFVEENGQLYCEFCFEQYIAPACDKCHAKIKEDCLNAIGKHFHPECFSCVYCGKLFGNNPFFLEDGLPYCEADWNELFTTKCFACGFPVEAGDRWVEALNNNYHSQCFNCTVCKKNLEGQSFFARGGRPFCRVHAR
ncbi:PDZ and LIM domain protein Zasp isoform X2 [Pieris brassicae]|uniref:PDZ and LIM domain protein Zasp isoform X2 n=1 Tax=Pieris brassicae TaxID=7116 RepID=UPI001E65E346|nr:PDZ and LIM domain protein Zasp isoform X2 [Pieris brassicae]